jgi:D-inositol-3-phosphate glycosyltransferase
VTVNHLLVSYHTCPLEEPGTGLAGGMNIFLRGLLSGLGRLGIGTDVLTRADGETAFSSEPFPGVRVIHVPCGWSRPPSRESAWRSLPAFVEGARALLRERRVRYDVVSAHYWMSGHAARALEPLPPLVFMYHTVEARKVRRSEDEARLSAVRAEEEEALARGADLLVCLSAADLEETRRLIPGVSDKGVVIPPGVDGMFRRPPPREESRRARGIPPEAVLFLIAARPGPGKNVPAAVDALLALRAEGRRNALLLVAGQEPPPGGALEGVVYAGAVPHAGMPALYAAADAVLCPSFYESFGFVPLEAAAAGVPVLVPSGGYWGGTVRRKGGGLVYDPGDPAGLLSAMRRICGDDAARTRLGKEGRRLARPFTWGRCTASWGRLLASASTRGSRR